MIIRIATISDAKIVLNSLNESLSIEAKAEAREIINDSINKLSNEIVEAEGVYKGSKVTQSQLDNAKAKLKVSIEEARTSLDAHNKYKLELELAENKSKNAVAGEGNGQFLQADIDILKAVIEKAKNDYKASITTEEVNIITNALKKATEDFGAKAFIVNNNALESAINNAEEIAENTDGKYYEDAIKKFVVEINKAKAILGDENSSQAVVDAGVSALLEAQRELLELVIADKISLSNLVNDSNTLLKKLEAYESLKDLRIKLENEVEKATIVLENKNATKEEIDTVYETLNKAYDDLRKASISEVDKTALGIAVNYARDIKENGGLYNVVPAVVKEFEAVLAEAQNVLSDKNASESQVYDALDRLVKVIHMVDFKKGDKLALEKLVQIIKASDESKYIASTWNVLSIQLENANKVLFNENSMGEEVVEAYKNLVKSYLDLRLIPNKDALRDLMNKAEAIDISKYTKESVRQLKDKLDKVKDVLGNNEATQEEVDEAEAGLELALNNLEVKEVSNNSNGDNKNNSNSTGITDKNGKGNDSLSETGGASPIITLVIGSAVAATGGLFARKKKQD